MKSSKFAVIIACLALAATGCGSSGNGSPNATGGAQQGYGSGAQGGPGGGGPGGGGPGGGGSGKVAAVSGNTAQVQNQSGQVAVSWTAKTAFAQEVATKASALKVGDCVVAMPDRTATPGSASATTVAAATVRISAPVSGACTNGFRAGGRGPAGGPPSDTSNAPNGSGQAGTGQGGQQGGQRGGFGAFGKVTAVSGSGFTVDSTRPGTSSSTSVAVTTTGATTWSTTKKATAKAVVVGQCVNSMGRPDSTGAITAASITVSSPVGGQCAVGFGGRPGGLGAGQGGTGGGQDS
jgi:Domain of unknown function (DUF5666)